MTSPRPGPIFKPLPPKTRLGLATLVGVATELILRRFWPPAICAILAWNAAVFTFLFLTYQVLAELSIEQIRRRAAMLDTAASVMLGLVVLAACVSLFGLGLNLHGAGGVLPDYPALRIALAGLTVIGSWSLIHTIFALHYTHLFYGKAKGGLIFPGKSEPNYWDFMYYSFVVGMTFQVSDVQIASHELRRLTLIHGVLSFFFNTVILALAVSVGAGLL
jgi:uncharacterized membrane protein